MPDNLTEDEKWAIEVDEAKHNLRKTMRELAGLVGEEDARQFVEANYPFKI